MVVLYGKTHLFGSYTQLLFQAGLCVLQYSLHDLHVAKQASKH